MDPRGAERKRSVGAGADARRSNRNAEGRRRSAAQARDGWRVPRRVYGWRSAAVGRRRAAAPDAAHPAERERVVDGSSRSSPRLKNPKTQIPKSKSQFPVYLGRWDLEFGIWDLGFAFTSPASLRTSGT